MRWRREALRRGATFRNEGNVFSRKELRENGLDKSDNCFSFNAEYKGFTWQVAADDALEAYRMFVDIMDYEDECGYYSKLQRNT